MIIFTSDALHEIAERIHKRSLVVIFSDMFESTDHYSFNLKQPFLNITFLVTLIDINFFGKVDTLFFHRDHS